MSSIPILAQRHVGNKECRNCNTSHNLKASCSRSSDSHVQKSGISNSESSDSEDDLDIVLNDEDCKEFQVATENSTVEVHTELDKNILDRMADLHVEDGGSVPIGDHTSPDYQMNTRLCRSPFSNNKRFNEFPGMTSYSSIYARPYWINIGEQRHAMNSWVPPCGEGPRYSLPWNRTIFDVNIDEVFEKRWRYPGVDLSDFFNFGLNEDSWKRYCILLEHYKQQCYLHHRNPLARPSTFFQADWRVRFQ